MTWWWSSRDVWQHGLPLDTLRRSGANPLVNESATRFDSSPQSGLARAFRYVTEGVFMRQLLADPQLHGVAVVVLDEFHERRLQVDLALSWLRALQQTSRPHLALVVMSATLDAGPIASFLAPLPRRPGTGATL